LKPPFNVLHSHDHLPNFVRLAHIKGDELLDVCATNSKDKPRDILNKYYSKMTKREIANAKSRNAASQKIRRQRNKKLGKVPVAHTTEEIVIPESQHFTIVQDGQSANEGETFYYEDSKTESPFRVIVFTTNSNLKILQKHRNWLADGTFDIAPKLMKQLYTIHTVMQYKTKEI
jgi:hypothetical protein